MLLSDKLPCDMYFSVTVDLLVCVYITCDFVLEHSSDVCVSVLFSVVSPAS